MRTGFLLTCGALALLAQSAGGLKWTAPTGWQALPGDGQMRAATYKVPATAGDSQGADCVVYFFGQGQGGSIEANLNRWKAQFSSEGKPAQGAVAKKTVHNLKVTTVDVSGEYSGMGGPMSKGKPVPGYRLLGAIIEGPRDNNLFVKFTGPAKTVAANQAKFEALIASFDKQ
jgi:hypothetical protein